MTQAVPVWIVIVAALVAANLPFFNDRLFAVFPLKKPKALAVRLAELVVLYFAVGLLGVALEKSAGQVAAQGWEFYAVTAAMFVTFAFPGFVWRYLVKHR
ncbi:MAG TPA: DUF2818 family protein [Ramlibacter sp.]|nr:DUF2818 family protein [Ramlibacter sp.]